MLIPIIETDSASEIQTKLDLYHQLDIPDKPTHFQIDVVDGIFADMITVMPSDLKDINWHGFTHEYHLLVNEPDEYLEESIRSEATKVIAQIERMHQRQDFIATVKQHHLIVGLGLDIATPIEELTDTDLQMTDEILLLAVTAGFMGQTLNSHVYSKIKELRQRGFTKPIIIDGGVNQKTIPELKTSGASHFAVNSALWHDGKVAQNLTNLLSITKKG